MRQIACLIALVIGGCSVSDAQTASRSSPARSSPEHPVVLELFQSQGCSSCPPANANVNALADRPDILALSFSVTYWDYLGWKDRFARPEFTQRQRDYAQSRHSDGVYTPQVVLNGSAALVGVNRGALDSAIQAAGGVQGGPALSVTGGSLDIAAQPGGRPARVLLVTYDPQSREVPISAGENQGRTLPHRHIVTGLTSLGTWTGAKLRLAVPAPTDRALRRAVLLQQGSGGTIVAALKLSA